MAKYGTARVWLVDDREENRRSFAERHGGDFDVRTFETPDQLMAAIKNERNPDALLCDIFYYENPEERELVEAQVTKEAKRIENLAADLQSDRAAEGIVLIERVRREFHNNPQFPIYAYTSKGPYLLHNANFDRLEALNARWLFKGKYSPQSERHRINLDIEEFRQRKQWKRRIWNAALKGGAIGAILGVVIDRIGKLIGI